jgi:hypothetical protein
MVFSPLKFEIRNFGDTKSGHSHKSSRTLFTTSYPARLSVAYFIERMNFEIIIVSVSQFFFTFLIHMEESDLLVI